MIRTLFICIVLLLPYEAFAGQWLIEAHASKAYILGPQEEIGDTYVGLGLNYALRDDIELFGRVEIAVDGLKERTGAIGAKYYLSPYSFVAPYVQSALLWQVKPESAFGGRAGAGLRFNIGKWLGGNAVFMTAETGVNQLFDSDSTTSWDIWRVAFQFGL